MSSSSSANPVDKERLQGALGKHFAPWIDALELKVIEAMPGEVVLTMPFARALVHAGGVVCGQAMMSAADTAMVLAVITELGEFRPMTTVQLQTSFLRPISSGDARVTARVLRRGKNLCFGEIEVHDAAGKLAAHATTTYALL